MNKLNVPQKLEHIPSTCTQHMYPAHVPSTYTQHMYPAHVPSTCTQHIYPAHIPSTYTQHMYPAHIPSTCTIHSINTTVEEVKPKSFNLGIIQWGYIEITNCMSSDVETASHAGHCPINLVNVKLNCTCSHVYKSGENRSKCLVVGSMFPHSDYINQNIKFSIYYIKT